MIQVKTLKLSELREAPDNPNRMDPDTFAALTAAIKRFGCLQFPLVRFLPEEGEAAPYEIVDGHMRKRASTAAGLEEISCIVCDNADDEALALRLGMNRMRGDTDLASVGRHLEALAREGWSPDDMQLTGFSMGEIDSLLEASAASADDALDVGTSAAPEEEPPPPAATFLLEITFTEKVEYQAARRALRRAAGKGGSLADGLLAVLAIGEEPPTAPAEGGG